MVGAMRVLVHAEIHGLSGRAGDLATLLTEHATAMAAVEGSLGSAAYAPLGAAPGEYVLEGWWRDEAAMRAHYASAEYARYAALVGDLLARPSDVTIHLVDESVRAVGDPAADPTRQD